MDIRSTITIRSEKRKPCNVFIETLNYKQPRHQKTAIGGSEKVAWKTSKALLFRGSNYQRYIDMSGYQYSISAAPVKGPLKRRRLKKRRRAR